MFLLLICYDNFIEGKPTPFVEGELNDPNSPLLQRFQLSRLDLIAYKRFACTGSPPNNNNEIDILEYTFTKF